MKYSLSPKELSNWKGAIAQRLVESYIERDLSSALKEKEGWSEVFFCRLAWCPLNAVDKALLRGEQTPIYKKMPPYWQSYHRDHVKWIILKTKKIFVEQGVFPNEDLFGKYLNLLELLEVATDGFLLKLKRTREKKPMEKIISELGEYVYPKGSTELPKEVPIVEGQIEIIEIKLGKSNIPPHQKANYRKVLKNGYSLRYFYVDIISFESNNFEIEEKLIRYPNELASFPIKRHRKR